MIRLDIASDAQHHFTNDNFHQRAAHRRKALEPHRPVGVYGFVPDRSPRHPRLASPTKQLRRSHSDATGNRRNIGTRNKRLLHKPGLRLRRPAAPSPKRPRLQMLDHLTISIIRHRRTYRNFHHQISGFTIPKTLRSQSTAPCAVSLALTYYASSEALVRFEPVLFTHSTHRIKSSWLNL